MSYTLRSQLLLESPPPAGPSGPDATYTSMLAFWMGGAGTVPIVAGGPIQQALSGTLTFNGTLLKSTSHTLSANLSFTGTLLKQIGRSLTAVVSFAGTALKQTGKRLAGTEACVGDPDLQ